ncbi:MAG: hypothetical protein ABIA04_02905 [Pseudomonadota bacterium]
MNKTIFIILILSSFLISSLTASTPEYFDPFRELMRLAESDPGMRGHPNGELGAMVEGLYERQAGNDKLNKRVMAGASNYAQHFSTIFVMVTGSIISSTYRDYNDLRLLYSYDKEPVSFLEKWQMIGEYTAEHLNDAQFWAMFNGAMVAEGAINSTASFGANHSSLVKNAAKNMQAALSTAAGTNIFGAFMLQYLHTIYIFSFWEIIGEWLELAKYFTLKELHNLDPGKFDPKNAVYSEDYKRDVLTMLNITEEATGVNISNIAHHLTDIKGMSEKIERINMTNLGEEFFLKDNNRIMTYLLLKNLVKVISQDTYRRLLIYNTFRKHMLTGHFLTFVGSMAFAGFALNLPFTKAESLLMQKLFTSRFGKWALRSQLGLRIAKRIPGVSSIVKGGLIGLCGVLISQEVPRYVPYSIDLTIKYFRHLYNEGKHLGYNNIKISNLLDNLDNSNVRETRDKLKEVLEERKKYRELALTPLYEFHQLLTAEVESLKEDVKLRKTLQEYVDNYGTAELIKSELATFMEPPAILKWLAPGFAGISNKSNIFYYIFGKKYENIKDILKETGEYQRALIFTSQIKDYVEQGIRNYY